MLIAAGIEDLFEAVDRRASSPSASTCRASRRRTRFSPARARSASSRRRRSCSRTRSPACRPAAPATSGSSSASIASGQADALRAHGADVVVRDLAELLNSRDPASGVPGRAVGGPRDRARPRPAGADRVGVRALQRPHRAARQPRRGRAVRAARHLSERLLRGPTAAVRRGRLRLSRGRPDDRQRHQRQDHPPAGRGRAVRRALRRAAQPRAGARPPRRRAAPRRSSGSRRPGGAVRVSSTRLVSFTQRAVAAIAVRGRAARRRDSRSSSSRSWSPTSRCAEPQRRSARGGRARGAAASPSSSARDDTRAILAHRTAGQRADGGRGDGPRDRRARRDGGRRAEAFADVGALRRSPPTLDPGQAAADRQVRRLRLVGASAPSPALRDQVAAALAEARHDGLGRARRRSSATTSTTSGSAPTSSSRATPSSSRRCASRSSTCSRPAPAPSSARSRPRA